MHFEMYINGRWQSAREGGVWQVVNPATEAPIMEVPFGSAGDALDAISAAEDARRGWANTTAYERGALLRRVADLIRERLDTLAPLMTQESGKPLAEARAEWVGCADYFDWFGEEAKRIYGRTIPSRVAGKRLTVIPQPLGVVATITAWNFPASLISRKWAAALAAGCTLVGRPSELTPLSAMALTNLIDEAGFPAGVVNLVNGEPEAMGRVFTTDARVQKVSFTGSQRVGSLLMRSAADQVKRLALELGGSAPVLVFGDVDVEATARHAVGAKFRNNGQVCVSPTRFYVHREIYEDFIEVTREMVSSLVVGDGLTEGVNVGPMVSSAGREKVEGLVDDALLRGAVRVSGGRRPPQCERGYFYEPTILTGVTDDQRIAREEIFGPVMPIQSFDTLEEGLARANATPYGLAAYVFTQDISLATRAYEGLEFGMVGLNDMLISTPEAPFGAVKMSGYGREGGHEGIEEYLAPKLVTFKL